MIHAATAAKAVKHHITLVETEDAYRAHYNKKPHLSMIGEDPPKLLKAMIAVIDMAENYKSFSWAHDGDAYTVTTKTPELSVTSQLLDYAFEKAKKEWLEARAEMDDDELAELEAEAEAEEPEEEEGAGSVVKEKYRLKYKEEGHPNNCGDELALFLAEYCKGSTEARSIVVFEAVCNANGVSLTKYRHEGNGWEGRLRMTGRNILARVVFEAEGKLVLLNDDTKQMSAEWMANQRFTKKGEQPAPVAAPVTETAAAE